LGVLICLGEPDDEPVTLDCTDILKFEELLLDGVDCAGILPEDASVLLPKRLALGSFFE
jgi:hypothetical protein